MLVTNYDVIIDVKILLSQDEKRYIFDCYTHYLDRASISKSLLYKIAPKIYLEDFPPEEEILTEEEISDICLILKNSSFQQENAKKINKTFNNILTHLQKKKKAFVKQMFDE